MLEEYYETVEIEKAEKLSGELLAAQQSGSLGKGSENAVLQLWRGRIKFKMKQYGEAAICFRKSLELIGDKEDEDSLWQKEAAYAGMMEAYLEAGETGKAEDLAMGLLRDGESKAQDLIQKINNQYKINKETRKSYEFGMKLYEVLPEGGWNLRQETREDGVRLIEEHVSKEEWGKAEEICEGLMSKDAKNAVWYIWAGRINAGRKLYVEAAGYFEKGLELIGDEEDEESGKLKETAYYGMIRAYFETGEIEKAKSTCDGLLKKDNKNAVLHIWAGRINARMKQYAEEASSFENGLELIGDKTDEDSLWQKEAAYAGMMEAYLEAGETGKAEYDY